MNSEMILTVSAILTLLIAVGATALAILNRRDIKRCIRILGVCMFLMLMTAIYPYYANEGQYALGLTLVESMCAMLLNTSPAEILAGFDGYSVSFIGVYKVGLLILLTVAPLFTVGITLSFFSDKFTRISYRVRSALKDSYLFSAINERTLCIAEDIAAGQKRAVIVFVLRISKEDMDAETVSRIKAMGAYVINDDIVSIRHSLAHKRNYYILDTDGSENLKVGLRLYEKYNDRHTDQVNMWLYTKNEMSEIIFDRLYETFNVRLINEEGLIARDLVSNYPLYNAIKEGKLSFLLVGGGNIGLEILRGAAMCACLDENVTVEMNVIDLNGKKAKAIFEKTSPRLAERLNIRFHSADIKTVGFRSILEGISPTYIVVSLGSENLNMETAIAIRRQYGITSGFPHIYALVDHKQIEENIIPNLSVSDWKYNKEARCFESTPICSFEIRTFGSYEDTYSNLKIGASYRDCLAVAVNAANRGITALDEDYTPQLLNDLYNQVCFYKEYSDAYAVSIPYKLYLLGLQLVSDGEGDLTLLEERIGEGAHKLLRHENQRYEIFMRSKGWQQMMPEEVVDGRLSNKLMKKHARLDLCYTPVLEEMTGRDFAKEDEKSIRNLPTVIRLANDLYGSAVSVRERKA